MNKMKSSVSLMEGTSEHWRVFGTFSTMTYISKFHPLNVFKYVLITLNVIAVILI